MKWTKWFVGMFLFMVLISVLYLVVFSTLYGRMPWESATGLTADSSSARKSARFGSERSQVQILLV